MARPSKQYPTEGELEVLQVIWDHGPSTVQDIVANLNRQQDDRVTYASVLSLVTVMHTKNLLTRWKSGRKHVYQAMIGRGETLQAILGKLFGIAFAGMPTEVAMHFLNRDHSISEAELTAMRQILAKVKNDESLTVLNSLLGSPYWQKLAVTLLHSLWQGTMIALLVLLVMKCTRRSSPSFRHNLCFAALIIMVGWILVTFFSDRALYSWDALASTGPLAVNQTSVSTEGTAGATEQPYALPASPATMNAHYPNSPWAELFYRIPEEVKFYIPLIILGLTCLWIVWSICLLIRTGLDYLWVSRLRRTGVGACPDPLKNAAERLAGKFHLTGRVRFLVSDFVQEPTACGLLKPLILLPKALVAELTIGTLEMTLAHELAHIRRRDGWVGLVQRLTGAIFFYHPFVRLISNHITYEREFCCDNVAIAVTGRRTRYAAAMEELAEWSLHVHRTRDLLFGASVSPIFNRFQYALHMCLPGLRVSWWSLTAMAVLLPLLVCTSAFASAVVLYSNYDYAGANGRSPQRNTVSALDKSGYDQASLLPGFWVTPADSILQWALTPVAGDVASKTDLAAPHRYLLWLRNNSSRESLLMLKLEFLDDPHAESQKFEYAVNRECAKLPDADVYQLTATSGQTILSTGLLLPGATRTVALALQAPIETMRDYNVKLTFVKVGLTDNDGRASHLPFRIYMRQVDPATTSTNTEISAGDQWAPLQPDQESLLREHRGSPHLDLSTVYIPGLRSALYGTEYYDSVTGVFILKAPPISFFCCTANLTSSFM